MATKEPRDFIYENHYSPIGSVKDNSYYSIKRQKKIIYYHFKPYKSFRKT